MKESKFIELLNLYVDHQITPTDADWLETEIQQKPERRQIYRQYCQMQKACVTLAENFRTGAPAAVTDSNVVELTPHRRRTAGALTLGAIAIAACATLVIVNRRAVLPLPGQPDQAVVAQAAPDMSASVPMAVASSRVLERPALRPAFAGLVHDTTASAGALNGSERATFEWITQVQPGHVPADQLWFEAQPQLQAQELMFHARPASQTQAEDAAFRFQR